MSATQSWLTAVNSMPAAAFGFGIDVDPPNRNRKISYGMIRHHLVGYTMYPITRVDGSYIISYKWPWSWFTHSKTIHMIGTETTDGIRWRAAPESEPVIADANNQMFKVGPNPPANGGYHLVAERIAR